jgi:1-phosphatidylinositol-3-phosphate 5-kinase
MVCFPSLFSFAKFLEVLIYSPAICTLTLALCEHTTPPHPRPPSDLPLPRSRLNIIRHFSCQASVVSFTLSAIDDIFELRVPRLQIIRGGDRILERRFSSSVPDRLNDSKLDDDKKTLRREMMAWWMGLSDYMNRIVGGMEYILYPEDSRCIWC